MTCTKFKSVIPPRARRPRASVFALALLAAASAGCSKDEPTQEQFLSRANEAFNAQHLTEAEKGYREVLRLRPDDRVAQRQLGIIYFDQGQLQQAFPLLRKSAELEPDNIDVQLKLALTYFTGRDYQKARESARQVLEKKTRGSGRFAADGRHRRHT